MSDLKPIQFKQVNIQIAEHQEEYITLPAYMSIDGLAITCWKLSIIQRLKLLCTGKLWHQQLTFNCGYQPIILQTDKPFEREE